MFPDRVVKAARDLIGTPFIHQGRVPGVGVDCVGVPILVAKSLGLGDFNQINYRRYPDGQLKRIIEDICQPIGIQPGALLLFKISVEEQHCGIVSNFKPNQLGLIHAWDIAKKCVEHRLTKDWLAKATGCYGLPGVAYK